VVLISKKVTSNESMDSKKKKKIDIDTPPRQLRASNRTLKTRRPLHSIVAGDICMSSFTSFTLCQCPNLQPHILNLYADSYMLKVDERADDIYWSTAHSAMTGIIKSLHCFRMLGSQLGYPAKPVTAAVRSLASLELDHGSNTTLGEYPLH
jgi:hypothetical protein